MKLRLNPARFRSRALIVFMALLFWSAPLTTLAKGLPGPEQPGQQQQNPQNQAPDTLERKERQEETGSQNPNIQTEREKRNIPEAGSSAKPGAPGQNAAQEAPPTNRTAIIQPLAQSPPVTEDRVGVNKDQIEYLTLQDAIALALKNNLDIEYLRQGVQYAQYNLFSARGVYDIVTGSAVNYSSQTFPVTSIFAGGGASSAVTQRTYTMNVTNTRQLETGGSVELDFDNNRISSSATSSTLNPQYNPSFVLSFAQPVMRNLSVDQNRHQIRLLKKSLDLSDSQFRQKVIDIINLVQDAYWELVFALQNEKIARDSVTLAETQLENNRKQVEAGTLAAIELRSNEAALESRKGDVINALQIVTTDENALKGLLLKDPDDKLWSSAIVPTDKPEHNTVDLSVAEAFRVALKNRPELEQFKLQQDQNRIDIAFFKSQLKPQLDVVGYWESIGVAGTPVQAASQFGVVVPNQFVGGYGQALRNMFSFNYQSYRFGISFSIPWKNRTAEGNLGKSLALSRQLDAQQRQKVQQVEIDVRNALQAVDAAWRGYQAAVANKTAAQAQLDGEMEKFRAGLSTNFLVLQRQTDLSTAKGSVTRTETNYNKALADLQHATGLTLVSNNVQVPVTSENPPVTGKSLRGSIVSSQ